MMKRDNSLEFTQTAMESLYRAVDDRNFRANEDAKLIFTQLETNLRAIPFGDYLKRYVYQKAGLTGSYEEIPLDEYRLIIRESFRDNETPASFTPTTAKLSALTRNWLTQQTVTRNVVFLLGFGLRMSVGDVNEFLVKALHEPEINSKNPFEVLCWYCYTNRYPYPKFQRLWKIYQETPPNSLDPGMLYAEKTVGVRNMLYEIHDDATLLAHLARYKTKTNAANFSVTARICFDHLYAEARELVAVLYNKTEEERISSALQRGRESLARNSLLFDYEKQERLEKGKRMHHSHLLR